MKKRWLLFLTVLLAAVTLFMPMAKLNVHSQLGEEIAAQFPATISMREVMLRGASVLPVEEVSPALGRLNLGGWMLGAGMAALFAGAVLGLVNRRGMRILAAGITALSAVFLATFAIQAANINTSLLFTLLIETMAWTYVPVAIAVVQLLYLVVAVIKERDSLPLGDVAWRRLCGALALVALVCVLLPAHTVSVPESITASAADAAVMNRSLPIYAEMLGLEPTLAALGEENGAFADVLTGDLAALEPYSADATNIRGIFTIRNATTAPNAMLCAAAVLLLLCAVLAFIRGVDRWFPVSCAVLATILIGASALGILSITEADMFGSATRQLSKLGLGCANVFPLLMLLAGAGSALCGVMSIRTADEPYFVNPIPTACRLRFTAAVLAVVALVMIVLPSAQFSFVNPGKSKVQSTVSVAGWQGMLFQTPEDVLSPKSNRGNPIYDAEPSSTGELTDVIVAATMSSLTRTYGLMTWAALIATAAGLALLLLKKNRKLVIAAFLAGFVLRAVTWLLLSLQMPKVIGSASGTAFLYISLPLLVFAAFFANFAHMEELPKKYKLFLMMLPFLLAVFLFSYLPLYGWSYAFYNYKFGVPMSEQEFVGFKWFAELITNPGHRENIVRVMKNTFGMSGLNLITSWMPMVFAIFLNEVTNTRFKKFVQIFTTLPNFISWALVFSFAMCLFAMDTGIFSKLMLAVGAIDEPVAWLNSGEHIWLKMWLWSTWKGLGWGAIMYLAAIAGIPQELYEAARVDGAGRWMQMRYITLPGLLPTFFVLLMLSISNILNNGMEQYMVFQNSMNKNTIEVLDLYVYNISIASKGTTLYSFATAIGILKTVVSVTLLFTANFASKKLRGESIV